MQDTCNRMLTICLCFILSGLVSSCSGSQPTHSLPDIDESLALMTRLEAADFSLVTGNPDIVALSREYLAGEGILPNPWPVEFAGAELEIPDILSASAVGIPHTTGRTSVVYLFPEPGFPEYGELVPIAVAHYHIDEPEVNLVILLAAFQSDPGGSESGIGVRSVNTGGVEMSAPFALALKPEDLAGKFFYDEFMSGSETQRVAARKSWDQGILLLTRIRSDAVVSTYLPWY